MTGHVEATLRVLREYYCDKDGRPRQMNPVQITVYTDGLLHFSAEQLETAARQWMKASKWFPALSDLLELLEPKADATTSGHLAWTCVERAIRTAGVYRGATFVDGRIGEAMRLTFGTWSTACNFDIDAPGWAIRRQTFLSIFESLRNRKIESVTLPGIARADSPALIPALELMPSPTGPTYGEIAPATHAEAVAALSRVGMLPRPVRPLGPPRPTRPVVEAHDE
jgi:hypothetical protein